MGQSRSKFWNLIAFLGAISAFTSASPFNACPDGENQSTDVTTYYDIKKECYHFIYNVYRNLPIWEWPDSMVKYILKTHLEDYLIEHLNTLESRKLHQKYETVDWDIHAMMRMHLSDCDQIEVKN